MNSLTLKSPAKLNLYLNVLKKRPDGYHEIETLFERINLCDRITLRRREEGITLRSNDKTLPTDERNIAFKAALLLKEKFNVRDGVSIYIEKQIPVGGGLGGGSSNAASTLMGLNSLWQLGLKKDELIRLGKALGADVPFFLMDAPFALGYGIGDKLRALPKTKELWHVVVNPGIFVSTRDVYKRVNLALTRKKGGAKILASVLSRRPEQAKRVKGRGASGLLYNSLESAVLPAYKEIAVIKDKLRGLNAPAVLMSGSGSTVFAVCENERKARALRDAFSHLKKKKWRVFVARTW